MLNPQRVMPGDTPVAQSEVDNPGRETASNTQTRQGAALSQDGASSSHGAVPFSTTRPANDQMVQDGRGTHENAAAAPVTERKSAPGRRVSGLGLILVGIWGAGIPFVGPLLGFRPYGNLVLAATTERLVLSVAPGLVAILAGLVLLSGAARGRFSGTLASLAAIASGVWFSFGPTSWPLVHGVFGAPALPKGTAVIGNLVNALIAFQGLGLVVVLLAGVGLASSIRPRVKVSRIR